MKMKKTPDYKYYVTMIDTFMSGWGEAKDRKNKLAFECESYEEAQIVAGNGTGREEMKWIYICANRPKQKKGELLQFKTKEEMGAFYTPNKWGAPW
ncbi:hypothetical protein ABINADI_196 [Bacillus phage vB_BanH_Abinadi]|nr:hypothetical protein ABINADI_196 [Bacillus phage vB_BanH_Abinadi]